MSDEWRRGIYMEGSKTTPPTEDQTRIIGDMRNRLNAAGVNCSFIIEPESNFTAHFVINSLMRLCKKHGV